MGTEIMRKPLSFIMAVCLTISLLIGNAPASSSEDDSFVFRDGITWGMSKEDIIALEGNDYRSVSTDFEDFELLNYMDKQVSDYPAELNLAFYQNSLICAGYFFYPDSQEDIDNLILAYTTKYGESHPGKEDFLKLYQLTQPDYAEYCAAYDEDNFFKWYAPGNTYILIFMEPVQFETNSYTIATIYYIPPELPAALAEINKTDINPEGI